jgi:hypothetical protein
MTLIMKKKLEDHNDLKGFATPVTKFREAVLPGVNLHELIIPFIHSSDSFLTSMHFAFVSNKYEVLELIAELEPAAYR